MADVDKCYDCRGDLYSWPLHAAERSREMGMAGEIHLTEIDGVVWWRPGANPNAYYKQVALIAHEELRIVMENAKAAMESIHGEYMAKRKAVAKQTEELRLAYGWANVSVVRGEDVIDLQGDMISSEELEKAARDYMRGDRIMKMNHEGDAVGKAVFLFPLTKEVKEALHIESPYEGLIIGSFLEDDNTWNMVKSGELSEFSIGGTSEVEDA